MGCKILYTLLVAFIVLISVNIFASRAGNNDVCLLEIDWGYGKFNGSPYVLLDNIEFGLREDGVVVWKKR